VYQDHTVKVEEKQRKNQRSKSIPGKLKKLQRHAHAAMGIQSTSWNQNSLHHWKGGKETSTNISAALVLQNRVKSSKQGK